MQKIQKSLSLMSNEKTLCKLLRGISTADLNKNRRPLNAFHRFESFPVDLVFYCDGHK